MLSAPLSTPSDAPAFATTEAPLSWRDRWLTTDNLVRFGVLALAAFLRLFWLDQRPPHFDEGVNGWFTDQMQKIGYYKYDPSNYHGPLHFYVLFLFKTLFGRNLWALRLPVALVGILTVDWCFRFRAFFGRRVCTLAALGLALSPGMNFFHRDAIHETWLVFFLVLAFWGLCGLWQEGGKQHLWALAMGATGAILTKETYLIHFGCFLIALLVLWLLEDTMPSTRRPLLAEFFVPPLESGGHTLWTPEIHQPHFLQQALLNVAPQRYRVRDVLAVLGVSLALLIFFYAGNFYNWSGLGGLVSTFTFWGHKAQEGEGHNKDFIYWIHLLLLNEPVAVAGMFACLRYVVPPLPTVRFRPLGILLLVLCVALLAFEFWPGHPFFHSWRMPKDIGFKEENQYKMWFTFGTTALMAMGVACVALPKPPDWRLRLLAVYAGGTVLAYSLIPYKTPWCAISFIWPFFFVVGAVVVELVTHYATIAAVRAATWLAVGALGILSTWWMVDLNYRRPTEEHYSAAAAFLMQDLGVTKPVTDDLAYVYVQTYNDMWRITEPLLDLAEDDPSQYALRGVILCGSTYPLPWVLGDFTGIGYYSNDNQPTEYRADFLLVEDRRVAEAEAHLDAEYFREKVHLRPAQEMLTLYLRASLFGHYFPDRAPEFHPSATPQLPTGTLPPGTELPPPDDDDSNPTDSSSDEASSAP